MTFGVNVRGKFTGADAAVRIFQISSLLPLPYIFLASGYQYLFTKNGLFSALFDLGFAALPRAETLGLSALYRLSSSELAVYFLTLVLALIAGLAAKKLLTGKGRRPVDVRVIWAVLIALDLVFRLVPLPFASLPVWALAAGFLLRAACLILILLDLRAAKKSES